MEKQCISTSSTLSMKVALKEPDSSKEPPSKEEMQEASYSQYEKTTDIEKRESTWCYYLFSCLFDSTEKEEYSVAEMLTPEQRIAMGL